GGFAGTETLPIGEAALAARTSTTTLDGAGTYSTSKGTITKNGAYHVVTCEAGAAPEDTRLDGFTITGGTANGSGSKLWGAGMFNNEASPTVANCTFSENTADYYGGGMFNKNARPVILNCAFTKNYVQLNMASDSGGAGMFNDAASPVVKNCTFYKNNSIHACGGGMYNLNQSAPLLINCSFLENTSTSEGSGIFNTGSALTAVNCTFSGNTSLTVRGTIYNDNSHITLVNTILWANNGAGGDLGGKSASGAALRRCALKALAGDVTLALDGPADVIETDDMKLSSRETATVRGVVQSFQRLEEGSPALDAGLVSFLSGDVELIPPDDQLGQLRSGRKACIGSWEARLLAAPAILTSPTLPSGTAGVPYRHALSADAAIVGWALDGAPSWLSVETDGTLSGTPEAGTYAFTITASNAAGADTLSAFLFIREPDVPAFAPLGADEKANGKDDATPATPPSPAPPGEAGKRGDENTTADRGGNESPGNDARDGSEGEKKYDGDETSDAAPMDTEDGMCSTGIGFWALAGPALWKGLKKAGAPQREPSLTAGGGTGQARRPRR
ncbi:MAG: putative Ig domain-containing protein, partial [Fretibacterium sp.]|nr:putative Ig domain-containing protein [Fretibacterium sp.]